MKKTIVSHQRLIVGFCLLIIMLIPPFQASEIPKHLSLPPPQPIPMILEETMFRRASIRDYANDSVSDQDLSAILWAAYGNRGDGTQTTPPINSTHAAKIYVCTDHGVYTYVPQNHSLLYYKAGDYTHFFQYDAPIQLGIVWNTTASTDENLTAAEIGMIGQNIYLAANALNLATLSTVGQGLALIHLPDNEIPLIIMPLGHPKYPYDFRDKPLVFSLLPRVQRSGQSLSEVLNESTIATTWNGIITRQQQAQLLWSAYGYSYYLDRSEFDFIYHINRHRTVPSAHKYYPLEFYAFTASDISHYVPNIYNPLVGPLAFLLYNISWFRYPVVTYLQKIKTGDHRSMLADACAEPNLTTASFIILSVLDVEKTRPKGYDDFSDPTLRWLWYYEAGASVDNVLLETTAWDLTTAILPIHDTADICALLNLDEARYEPLLVTPVGT